ncbi:MAG: transcription-repair coupling factor [Neisseriaceae bacterium]
MNLKSYKLTIGSTDTKHKLLRHLPSSDSLLIAKISETTSCPLLIITNDAYNANRIFDELEFFASNKKFAIFPDTEILPYERTTPQSGIIADRLKCLWQVSIKQLDIVIIQASTLQTRICPINYLHSRLLSLKISDKLSISELRIKLVSGDYVMVDRVYEAGEFAIRGGIIDIIPMGHHNLIRIELFDDEIESLKIIDPKTNQLIKNINEIDIIPTHEYPIDQDGIKVFINKFKDKFPKPSNKDFIKEIENGRFPAGSEFYLPLFFDKTATFLDYLDNKWQIINYSNTISQLNHNWQEINRRFNLFNYQYPCLDPVEIFIATNNIIEQLKNFTNYEIAESGTLDNNIKLIPDILVDNRKTNPFSKLQEFIQNFKGDIYLTVDSIGRLEVLQQTLNNFNINNNNHPNFKIIQTFLYNGFICNNTAFITEHELYKKEERFSSDYIRRHRNVTNYSQFDSNALIKDLAEIQVGDFVVHINHGIGKYLGLTTHNIGDISYDMLELEYQDEAKLFIPVQNLHLISRYTSINENNIEATKLGSNGWDKIKAKVEKRINDTAAELLELYAKRELECGHKFTLPQEYDEFSEQFGYEPTVDQEISFKAIIQDMINQKPMDRLICGDVGFGKTEVAMRAAFICAMNGKQVALLTPTTLLTEQHYQNFINRFANFPLKIAEISRFKTKSEITNTLQLVKSGNIDILIGTHRLISSDVEFKNLGLIIIDEEHRFGVKQKERLKQLRVNVDTLAMTATPIPRTLSMALEGIRDFSIIATAPQRRLAVNTIICNEDKELIREAILREIRRGGQIFFLYNDVATISNMYDKLINLMPELNISIAHGQMNEHHLEQTIKDFIRQKYNILLCSTIIETGIDIANANTIFIYRADKLGLAQLHQLRGRVGRSHHQAYCYMIVPENITKDAKRRLEAISMTSELGSGFHLALHDLEIRGAGEILGDKQSGDIKEVGLSLYTDMLKKAIRKLKNNLKPDDFDTQIELASEVNINITTILPHDYCNSVHERLIYYKRLAKARTVEDIDAIYQDIINTHGIAPLDVKNLINSHYLRVKTLKFGISKLDISEKSISITFLDPPKLDPIKMVELIQELKTCKIVGNNKLIWHTDLKSATEKFAKADYLLDNLSLES